MIYRLEFTVVQFIHSNLHVIIRIAKSGTDFESLSADLPFRNHLNDIFHLFCCLRNDKFCSVFADNLLY